MRMSETRAARVVAAAAQAHAMRESVEAAAPVVRRIVSDPKLRAALRELVEAGRDVGGEIRRDGGRAVTKELLREDRLASEIDGSAKVLHRVANRMSRARTRTRRHRVRRALVVTGVAAGAGLATWRAIRGAGCSFARRTHGHADGAMHNGPARGADPAWSPPTGTPAPGA